MTEKYRISVIMGIYNCAPTLAEALDSLLAQTYQSFKVIMCDDGSTDNTMEVAQQYVDRYPGKFILIKNEHNLKLAATLNHCLEYVDTEYVARMDGDDISMPTRFEKQIMFLDENPQFALVSCPMIYFDENGDWAIGTSVTYPGIQQFKKGAPHCHAPAMLRTKTYLSVNGYTANARTERVEDYYLWYKIYRAGMVGANLSEPLYKMRDDKNAFSRRTIRFRVKSSLIKYEVCKNLGIPHALFYAMRDLSKCLVPSFIIRQIRKNL
jgi:glycosyltransferase EpsE